MFMAHSVRIEVAIELYLQHPFAIELYLQHPKFLQIAVIEVSVTAVQIKI